MCYNQNVLIHTEHDDYYSEPRPGEIRLRHLTVDEAMLEIDRGLNEALMAGFTRIRVIHGKGSGTLRLLVRQQLGRHPLVKSLKPGGRAEGGAGVTIVELNG